MNKEFTDSIKTELEGRGYDFAVAVATCAEVEAGAACGQLSIITETNSNSDATKVNDQ